MTLPSIYHKDFPKLVCMIDCTEIFIERPFSLMARVKTFSNYKKHNTVKYLIGITPTGSISFLTNGWGGHVTDDELTRSSGFFNHLISGDVVMADRGFRLNEDFVFRQCQLVVPAFTRGKKQLSAKDVERSQSTIKCENSHRKSDRICKKSLHYAAGNIACNFGKTR